MANLPDDNLLRPLSATPHSGLHAVKASPPEPEGAISAPEAPSKFMSRRQRRLAREAALRGPEVEIPEPEVTAEPDVLPAVARPRHYMALGSFLICVVLPFVVAVGYLYTRAVDQYHSEVAFSIRSEGMSGAAAGLLGAITQISGGGSASDSNILFEYIHSQKIVEDIDSKLDLRTIYNKAPGDFVFALGKDITIERLVSYWNKMVDVSFEGNTGILHVRANAFTPQDAQAITEAILTDSSGLVNRLSDKLREDAVRFAQQELGKAQENLRQVRNRLATFRRENRIVDPSADAAGRMGLLNALQSKLAQALVERDMLLSYAAEDDQRVIQANRQISAINTRIDDERRTLGVSDAEGGGALPEILGSYEELLVDLKFANTAYTRALAGLTGAQAAAQRQSRYLAAHIEPTLAESALYPKRALLAGLTGLFLMLGWSVLMLIYYNVRDNR